MSVQKGRGPGMGGPRRGPMRGFGAPVEKPKDFKGTLKRLIRYLKPHRIHLIVVIIFAILSTSFNIAAPKVMSKGMNKLQDGYMANTMINKMSDGQTEARIQILDKMTDAQKDIKDKIAESMAKSQNDATDEIIVQFSDAQDKAKNEVYDKMTSAQNSAKNGVITQMAKTQEQLVTQLQQMISTPEGQTESGQNPASGLTQEDLKTIQDIMSLPLINSQNNFTDKKKTTISFIELLKKMPQLPGSESSSVSSLNTVIDLLNTTSISSASNKRNATLNLVNILSKMPDSSNGGDLNAVKNIINSSSISSGKDYDEKVKYTLSFIDSIGDMPEGSGDSDLMDKDTIKNVKELLQLPLIGTITDKDEKLNTTIQLLELFKNMPDISSDENSDDNSGLDIDKSSLDTVISLLKFEDIDAVKGEDAKLSALDDMLVLLKDMPDISTEENTSDAESSFSSDDIGTIRDFLALPILDTIKSSKEKAEVTRKIMDLGDAMASMEDSPATNPDEDVTLTKDQIDSVITAIEETDGKIDFDYIGQIALLLIGMYLLSSLFNLVMGLVMSGVSQKSVRDLRRDVDSKFSRLPLKYFDLHPHGDMLSRVTNDVDTIATTLQQSLTQLITSVISIIGFIIMMLSISPTLTLIVIATLPLYMIATVTIAKKSQKYFASQQKQLGDLSGHVEEIYTGHKIVKAYGKEKDAIDKFNDINSELFTASSKAQFVSGIMFPIMNFISNLGYVLICIVGGIWITRSTLKIGDMLAFIQYTRSFTQPIIQTSNIANVIQSTVACAERVFEVLDEDEEISDSSDAVIVEQPKGNVTFEHVAFSYTEDEPLIEDMNLRVEKGHTIAIVGPTGAGKTTMVNLLMRFYEINDGKITVDGIDTREIKRGNLRTMFGMVLQDTWLFKGTIRENIAYGKENATEEEIIQASKAAHADHFIRTLSEGYDTVINEEGTNISQGQKQLLTIARAILANPTILILDEATSSVDTRTELLIQNAMNNLMKGRTSFVIAHRLSTIRDAEKILVMDHGSIIEMGNHKELLEANGFYAELYNSQFNDQAS